MTCRATRRERVLVSPRRPSPLPRDARARTSRGRPRLRRDPARRRRPGRRHDRPRRAGAAARRPGRARSPASSRPSPNVLGLLEPMAEIGRLAHAAGALFVAVVEPVSLAVLAPPGEYGADIAAGEGQPLGIPLAYGGPYLGILACRDAARPPDPGAPRRHDHRRRRQARLRDDAARPRAGHPAREGGQQHLHEPGALRARRRRSTSRRSGPHGLRDVAAHGRRPGRRAGGGPRRRRRAAPAPRART